MGLIVTNLFSVSGSADAKAKFSADNQRGSADARQNGAHGEGRRAIAIKLSDDKLQKASGRKTPERGNAPKDNNVANALLQVEIVSEPDVIFDLEADWRELEDKCNDDGLLYQSFDWCANYLNFMLQSKALEAGALQPKIITIRKDNGQLVALLPLGVKMVKGCKVLTGFTEPFQQYSEILLDPETPITPISKALARAFGRCGADYLHLGYARTDSRLAKCLKGIAKQRGDEEDAPYVDLRLWPDYETYYAGIGAKSRKSMRRSINRLEHSAPLSQCLHRGERQTADLIRRVYKGRNAWLASHGLTSRAFRDEEFEAFLRCFSNTERTGVEILAMSLCHGETAISDQWGFVYRGRYYAFMSTMDDQYRAFSPGKLHLGEAIKTCYEKGIKIVDFTVPIMPYKMTWTDKVAHLVDYMRPLTLRGFLQVYIWHCFIRPVGKKIVPALPAWARGLISRFILPLFE